MKSAIFVMLGLALGNFVWQWMTRGYNWRVAFERSFFQVMAIAVYLYAIHS